MDFKVDASVCQPFSKRLGRRCHFQQRRIELRGRNSGGKPSFGVQARRCQLPTKPHGRGIVNREGGSEKRCLEWNGGIKTLDLALWATADTVAHRMCCDPWCKKWARGRRTTLKSPHKLHMHENLPLILLGNILWQQLHTHSLESLGQSTMEIHQRVDANCGPSTRRESFR